MISDNPQENETVFDLTFDQSVTITESFYPPVSFSQLLSTFGGVFGFWLGIGILQIGSIGISLIFKLRSVVNFSVSK